MSLYSSGSSSGDRLFAIGDVHGCATELRILINHLPLDEQSTVVFLGDLVDRGPESKEVVETVLELSKSIQVISLMGNHEDMMLAFMDNPESEKAGMFIYNGGGATLASYGNNDGTYTIPPEHVQFLKGLRYFYQTDHYFFVHAGIPPELELSNLGKIKDPQIHNEMVWIREPFLSSDRRWGKVVVHGHTPVLEVEMKPNRINLDTGCVYDQKLTAMSFPSRKIYSVDKQERLQQVYLRNPGSSRVSVRFKGTIPIQIVREGQFHPFETVDYNEFGLYIRDLVANHPSPQFSLGEEVEGEIGSQLHNTAHFKGKVVRVDQDQKGIFYAIQMHTPIDVVDE